MTGIPFDGCDHTPPHLHGEHRTYRAHSCKCRPCLDARNAQSNRLRKRKLIGLDAMVDGDPVRAHLLDLRRAGLAIQHIADRAGMSRRQLSTILFGVPSRGRPPSPMVRRTTRDAILAIPRPRVSSEASPNQTMSAHGSARRLQALAAIGWSARAVAGASGIHPGVLHKVREDGRVTVRTAERIAAAYNRLWDAAPPSDTPYRRSSATRTRNDALRRGWAPPAAWDDHALDRIDGKPSAGRRAA